MTETTQFEQWMATVLQRPLPQNPMAQVRTLAKELAEGAAEGLWPSRMYFFRGELTKMDTQQLLFPYLEQRWENTYPNFQLLILNEYFKESRESDSVFLTRDAFDLIEEAESANIFISYKRSESSAFALLVLARLKMAGFEPFLDLALQPGDDWEKGLKERIQKYQYLIAILGKDTLKSEVCLKEIQWAIEAGLSIIPIWHNGFTYKTGEWDVSLKVDAALSKTHTIRVLEESALAYNNAIVELLNRFGVTP